MDNSILDKLKKNRKNLTEGSLLTYKSIINNIMKKNDIKDISYFSSNVDNVIDNLKDLEPKKRKTILSAIIVLLDDDNNKTAIKKYRDIMMKDSNKSKEEDIKQNKTDKQADNWLSYDEVLKVYNTLKSDNAHLLKKDKLTKNEFQRLQNYIILSMYVLIPPRRLLDYTEMKLRNYDKEKDNYIDDKFKSLVFNKYKTSKYYEQQKVDIPIKLKNILKRWFNINKNDYLFVDSKNNKLSPVKLNQRLNNIFDNNISVNMLRHIFITDSGKVFPKNMPSLEERKKIAEDMGHNVSEQELYRKIK